MEAIEDRDMNKKEEEAVAVVSGDGDNEMGVMVGGENGEER